MVRRLLTVGVGGGGWWTDREHSKIRRLRGDAEYGPGNRRVRQSEVVGR